MYGTCAYSPTISTDRVRAGVAVHTHTDTYVRVFMIYSNNNSRCIPESVWLCVRARVWVCAAAPCYALVPGEVLFAVTVLWRVDGAGGARGRKTTAASWKRKHKQKRTSAAARTVGIGTLRPRICRRTTTTTGRNTIDAADATVECAKQKPGRDNLRYDCYFFSMHKPIYVSCVNHLQQNVRYDAWQLLWMGINWTINEHVRLKYALCAWKTDTKWKSYTR